MLVDTLDEQRRKERETTDSNDVEKTKEMQAEKTGDESVVDIKQLPESKNRREDLIKALKDEVQMIEQTIVIVERHDKTIYPLKSLFVPDSMNSHFLGYMPTPTCLRHCLKKTTDAIAFLSN